MNSPAALCTDRLDRFAAEGVRSVLGESLGAGPYVTGARLVEQRPCKTQGAGSSPAGGSGELTSRGLNAASTALRTSGSGDAAERTAPVRSAALLEARRGVRAEPASNGQAQRESRRHAGVVQPAPNPTEGGSPSCWPTSSRCEATKEAQANQKSAALARAWEPLGSSPTEPKALGASCNPPTLSEEDGLRRRASDPASPGRGEPAPSPAVRTPLHDPRDDRAVRGSKPRGGTKKGGRHAPALVSACAGNHGAALLVGAVGLHTMSFEQCCATEQSARTLGVCVDGLATDSTGKRVCNGQELESPARGARIERCGQCETTPRAPAPGAETSAVETSLSGEERAPCIGRSW
jgi:hypothetical protein